MKSIVKPLLQCFLVIAILFSTNHLLAQNLTLRLGDKAPELSLPDANGMSYSLSSLKGNLVLLYFWDSHEPNTEILAPNLNVLYEKYRQVQFSSAQSFKILTISLDEDKSTWLTQVNRYRMTGIHVLDIYGQTPNLYNFRQVPTWFLLDEIGTIIGINSSLSELDRTLAARAISWNPATATTTAPATYSTTTNMRTIPMSDMLLMSDLQTQKERNGAIIVQQNPPAQTTETTAKPSVFGVETITTPTNAILPQKNYTKGPHYKVQLGAYRFLNSADFENVRSISEVFAEPAPDDSGLQRIILGDFKEKNEAVAAMAKAQTMGYPDAFVLLYDTEKRIRPLTKDEVAKIAKSKGIALSTPTRTTTTTSTNTTPLVKVADKIDSKEKTTTPATFNIKKETVTANSKVAKVQDDYFPTIADTKSDYTVKAAPLPGTTAATTIYTPSGTYKATDEQSYSYIPNATMHTFEASRVETYSTAPITNGTSQVGIGATIPTYVSMPKSATNVYTPATTQRTTTPIVPNTYNTTPPKVGDLSYGQLSESYSKSAHTANTGWQPVSSTTQSTGWQPANNTTNTNAGGVWVPNQISVFPDQQQQNRPTSVPSNNGSGTYYDNNNNFDWYPSNANKTTPATSNNKPATYNSSTTTTTPKPPTTNTTTLTPPPAQPQNNITPPPTTTKDPSGKPATGGNNDYLGSYVDSYMKNFEPKSSKKLKAKNKRDKEEEKENQKKEKEKKKKDKKKDSWLNK